MHALQSLAITRKHSGNSLGQVVRTHVLLSPSSIFWYQSGGSVALWLGS